MSRTKKSLTDEEKQAIQSVKQELREYREDIKYIIEKINDAEEVKSNVEKVTTELSFTKTSNSSIKEDRFAEAIIKLEDLKIECTEKMQKLLIKKFDIDDKIEALEQPYKNVLFYRYTRGKAWEEVATALGYDLSYTFDIHGEALYRYAKNNFLKIPE